MGEVMKINNKHGIKKLVMGPDPLTRTARLRVNLNNKLLDYSDFILMALFLEFQYFMWMYIL